MRLPGFVGPTYTSRSPNADAERCINLYPEKVESGHGVNDMYLIGTPGLGVFATLSDKPVRALFQENGRLFAVAGTSFFEVFSDGTWTRYGSVLSDANPATISSNGIGGQQHMIISGTKGYIFNTVTNTLQLITDDNFPAVATMGGFLDGYFVVVDAVNNLFQLSNLNSGLEWDGFNVAQRSFASDPLRSMLIDHREIWFQGEQTTEVWYNSGDESFPFQPIIGTFIEEGIVAPFSSVKLDSSIMWLQGDERGTGIAMRAQGYQPQRISNHAVEQRWKQYSAIDDVVSYAYQADGHAFWHLYFPQGDVAWTYDVATGMWHERALWDPDDCVWKPHLSRCHAFAFKKNLVGDRQSAAIYNMSLDLFTEDVLFPG